MLASAKPLDRAARPARAAKQSPVTKASPPSATRWNATKATSAWHGSALRAGLRCRRTQISCFDRLHLPFMSKTSNQHTMTPTKLDADLLDLLDQLDMSEADRASVRDAIVGTSMAPSESFSSEINARLATAGQYAKSAIESVPSPWPVVFQLLNAANSASTAAKRVLWINKAADALAKTYQPVSACKVGCTHCCHIPVNLTKAEAEVLGKAIGRKPAPLASHTNDDSVEFPPCSFLVNGKCSIYEWRPSVCRSHMNMDQDDLLCRLVPGARIPVPYLDTRPIVMSRVQAGGRSSNADIRQWFPAEVIVEQP